MKHIRAFCIAAMHGVAIAVGSVLFVFGAGYLAASAAIGSEAAATTIAVVIIAIAVGIAYLIKDNKPE